jgi:nucleotide-binding universal stress UspA family protein
MSDLYRRILVPTDFSEQSERAWTTARRLARALGAEVLLAHVVVEAPLFGESPWSMGRVTEVYESGRAWGEKTLEEWAAAARAEGVTVRTVLRSGVPHREIVALAAEEQADLIVIGTHGRGGVDRALLGSVADRVIRLASCPVLSVRA